MNILIVAEEHLFSNIEIIKEKLESSGNSVILAGDVSIHIFDMLKKYTKEVGYKYAIATDSGAVCISDDLFHIRRIGIFPKNKIIHLIRKVSGKYNFIKIKREIKGKG
ncbi:MAG: hypothetical protein LBT51_10370 [Fusobacteriaceae bacterium]|jgi:hypothetical protein|nr:hypothetical protein [Fusobacteriaceae bacterium]